MSDNGPCPILTNSCLFYVAANVDACCLCWFCCQSLIAGLFFLPWISPKRFLYHGKALIKFNIVVLKKKVNIPYFSYFFVPNLHRGKGCVGTQNLHYIMNCPYLPFPCKIRFWRKISPRFALFGNICKSCCPSSRSLIINVWRHKIGK